MTQQKSILITGCSTGIGYDAAKGLLARGWRVFATCRKLDDCDRLIAEGFESFPLDIADPQSIKAGVAEVTKRTGGTLDALFNNGAYAIPCALEDLPRDGFRAILETNLIGTHDLTCQVIPIMRAQGHGRIVQNSSILGFIGVKWRGAYNATKFALEGLSDTLRLEMKDANIDVILIEPGPITSDFRKNAVLNFEKWIDWKSSARREQYEDKLLKRLYSSSEKKDRFELPASAVTDKLIHAIESKRPRPRYYVTRPTYVMGFLKRILSTRMLDRILDKA